MPFRVIGMDLSLRHGAVVELNEDFSYSHWFYSDRAGVAKRSEQGTRFPPTILKIDDFHTRSVLRLIWIRAWLKKILAERQPYAVTLEDYAYDASQGSHQLGELGGIVRVLCWDRGTRLRLHSPGSIKMFGADNGTASKEFLVEKVRAKWAVDFSYYVAPAKKGKPNTDTSEDLVDAYVLARMALSEAMLRAGTLNLAELGTDKERQTFLRTTPTYPVNVLGREWVWSENLA